MIKSFRSRWHNATRGQYLTTQGESHVFQYIKHLFHDFLFFFFLQDQSGKAELLLEHGTSGV